MLYVQYQDPSYAGTNFDFLHEVADCAKILTIVAACQRIRSVFIKDLQFIWKFIPSYAICLSLFWHSRLFFNDNLKIASILNLIPISQG